jgi:hypothetical protein
MTTPGSTVQHAEPGPESSPGKHLLDTGRNAGTKGGTVDYRKAAEGGPTADYQARMKQFDHVKSSTPVVSFGGRPHGSPLYDRPQ